MSKVIFTNSDGTVSIMTPIEGTAEECAKRDLPDGTSYEVVDDSVVPTDRSFRNAWKQNGKTIETDMAKAREIHKTNIRTARALKFAELDVEFQRALETSADTSTIIAKKQTLRDAPDASGISTAASEADLKAQWDTTNLGASPYT